MTSSLKNIFNLKDNVFNIYFTTRGRSRTALVHKPVSKEGSNIFPENTKAVI